MPNVSNLQGCRRRGGAPPPLRRARWLTPPRRPPRGCPPQGTCAACSCSPGLASTAPWRVSPGHASSCGACDPPAGPSPDPTLCSSVTRTSHRQPLAPHAPLALLTKSARLHHTAARSVLLPVCRCAGTPGFPHRPLFLSPKGMAFGNLTIFLLFLKIPPACVKNLDLYLSACIMNLSSQKGQPAARKKKFNINPRTVTECKPHQHPLLQCATFLLWNLQ